jgi:hypothetical protein
VSARLKKNGNIGIAASVRDVTGQRLAPPYGEQRSNPSSRSC